MANTETDPLVGPHMSTLQITGSTDPDHADRLLAALGHNPEDAR